MTRVGPAAVLLVALLLAGCPAEEECFNCPDPSDDDDLFGGDDDDDDSAAGDDDDASDDDDTAPDFQLTAGRWEFGGDRAVVDNSCNLLSNPQTAYASFDVDATGGDLYDVDFADAGVAYTACQVFEASFGCPPEERAGAGEIDTDLDVDVDVRVALRGELESGARMLSAVELQFDCDGDDCAVLEVELGAEFPCTFTTVTTAEWVGDGDDDDDVADDDDAAPALPDIVGLSVDGDALPLTLEQGEYVDLGYTYANDGTATATLSSSNPLSNRVHLSTGPSAATSADILFEGVRTSDLVAFMSVAPRQVLVAPGTYSVVLEVDATNNVAESEEFNNELVAGTITVVASTVPEVCDNGADDDFDGDEDCDDADCTGATACLPDLQPLSIDGWSLPATVTSGDTITVGYSYENAGGGATSGLSAGNPMTNRLHLSTSTSIGDSIGSFLSATRTSDLNPGQSSSLTPSPVTLTAPAGTYYVLLSVDDEDVVTESEEGDNVLNGGQVTVN